MSGPQGMGVLSRPEILGAYDAAIMTLGPIFYAKPLATMPTYTAWESFTESVTNDIAIETSRGIIYYRTWVVESGNKWSTGYDALLGHANFDPFFEIIPSGTFGSYTSWESRATAYSTDLANISQKGPVYFRMWCAESGNRGTYEDHMNDSEIGAIFKIEDGIA